MTDQRKKYLLEAYHEMKAGKQFEAILNAIEAIQEAMSYATECHDLRLSDVDKLLRAQYKLQSSIDTEPNDYQINGWKECGIGQDDDADDDTTDE